MNELCRKFEVLAPAFGAHVALTGGCLYKDGLRKDLDIVVYTIRKQTLNTKGFMAAVAASLGISSYCDYGFCWKASLGGKDIDFLFPDRPQSDMPVSEEYPGA